ncbi:hypothetical protein AC1031_009968 [Aphanomyces cochlioides]|nr:hypothetical protein AC1031_009968 [Aphanomyces cochlioides]
MTQVKLLCAVYSEGTVFSVDIELSNYVGALQQAIFENQRYRDRFKDGERTTWLADDDNVKVFLQGQIDNKYKRMLSSWTLDSKEYFGAALQPQGQIHVLVQLPEAVAGMTTKTSVATTQAQQNPALVDADWTFEWLSEFHKSQVERRDLPSVGELAEFTEDELRVKIPVQDHIRGEWLARMDIPNPALINKLFRIDKEKPCETLLREVVYRVVYPVNTGSTKRAFISFWCGLIRSVLDFVIGGKSDRDTLPSAEPYRPDYLFLVDSVAVFRGEEEAPGKRIADPRQKLAKKLIWTYGEAPYLLGYAAAGFEISLCAITSERGRVSARELGRYGLESLEGRFQWLLAILNVARLLKSLASLCPESARGEYRTICRDQGVAIFLQASCVVKYFPPHL